MADHVQELQEERQHLLEVEIFLLDRLHEVQDRLGRISREIGDSQ